MRPSCGGTVYHYRDKTGLEADAVVVLDDGRWGAVEVKLGEKQVEEGAAHLLKLASRVDDSKEGAPSFLMVLTASKRPIADRTASTSSR